MQEDRFEGISKSVTRRQNTVAHYIATRPILDLSERSTPQLGARVYLRWWEKAGIDLEGGKKMEAEAATVLVSKSEPELECYKKLIHKLITLG